jgi:hypothetical protein
VAPELHSGGDRTPIPDPTLLTTAALLREVAMLREVISSQREIVETRLNGYDKAIELIQAKADRVPSEVDIKVGHLESLHNEKFASVALQFRERDTRSERESRDNKVAVDAAFAAQKEAASEQNKSNTLAIDKSERATAETLNKQGDLVRSTTDALAAQVVEAKERLTRIESLGLGTAAANVSHRADSSYLAYLGFGAGGLLLAAAGIVLAIVK